MRLTNEIKVYIDKKVRELYKEKLAEIGKQLDDESAKIKEVENELFEQARNKLSVFGIDLSRDQFNVTFCGYHGVKTAAAEELWEQKCEINRKIADTIESIYIELCLGGTKKDIDRLLTEAAEAAE